MNKTKLVLSLKMQVLITPAQLVCNRIAVKTLREKQIEVLFFRHFGLSAFTSADCILVTAWTVVMCLLLKQYHCLKHLRLDQKESPSIDNFAGCSLFQHSTASF